MNTRNRRMLLAGFALALAGAAPLAQAHDRYPVGVSLILPPFVVTSHHGYGPHAAAHYHGRQLCHLRHEPRYEHDDHYDRHRYYREH